MTPSVLASLDPGSHRAALVIARTPADGAPLPALSHPSPPLLLFSHVFKVGTYVPLAHPVPRTNARTGATWFQTQKHEVTRDDEQALARELATVLQAHRCARLLIEVVNHQHVDTGGKSPTQVAAAASAQSKELTIAERIASALMVWCQVYGIEVVTVTRASWLTALRRHLSAGLTPTCPPLPPKVGKGAVFDPLLRHHLPALFERRLHDAPAGKQAESDAVTGCKVDSASHPGELDAEAGEGGEAREDEEQPPASKEGQRLGQELAIGPDLRDAAAMLLSHLLPCPPPGRARQGARRPTRAAPPSPGTASSSPEATERGEAQGPRGSSPRSPTSPASGSLGSPSPARRSQTTEPWYVAMAADRRARGPAARREDIARAREAARAAAAARREAIGCTCPPGAGRPPRTCPAYALHVAAGAARRTPSS